MQRHALRQARKVRQFGDEVTIDEHDAQAFDACAPRAEPVEPRALRRDGGRRRRHGHRQGLGHRALQIGVMPRLDTTRRQASRHEGVKGRVAQFGDRVAAGKRETRADIIGGDLGFRDRLRRGLPSVHQAASPM